MKWKQQALALVTVAVMVALSSCSQPETGTQPELTSEDAIIGVVAASTYPLAYFVERLAAPLVEVRFPAAGELDPESWKPTPEDILTLQEADLIVLNGASYESWLANVSLSPTKLVDTSGGFADRLIALENVTTHSHGPEGEHEHSGTAFTTWLDLSLAVEQAQGIRDALVTRWPQQAPHFEAQFAALSEELQTLDAEIAAIVAADPDRLVLFSHPVYEYLEHSYGLNGKSLHWEPGEVPTGHMWHDFEHALKSHPAKWMLWEAEPLPTTVEKLERLGVSSVVFTPCSNRPEVGDFLSAMNQNIDNLGSAYK